MKRQWWHQKVAYQIYPKSFCDSNNDGIGDIRGIIQKLDYLQNLGIEILWLSPIYCSPLADQGYDISDYYDIDPRFGTLEDLDELIAEGKKRGIGIVMDLVVNHCSDEHEWFKKACEDPDGYYGKFFYIEDYKKGDPLPCNWRSYFGGSCWEPLPGHEDKIYLHVFHKKQPDLNWENPELRKEVYKMINWWLDRGIAGFRIDAIINIKKKLPFCNYPADREDGLSSINNMLAEATGIGEFLNEMADETFRKYNAFSVGEVFNEKDEEIPDFIGDNGYFSSMFDFSTSVLGESERGWMDQSLINAESYKNALFDAHTRVNGIGFLSNIIENHDQPRGVCRYIPKEDLSEVSKKMLAGIYFFVPGLPFIYQGQEIGMENYEHIASLSDLDDCANFDIFDTLKNAGYTNEQALEQLAFQSRDNARSPFQWSSRKNAGFSEGTPWLMVNPNYKSLNLEKEQEDPDSIYYFYKKMIDLRKSADYSDTLIYGEFEPYHREQKNLLAYTRRLDKNIIVIANYQQKPQEVTLPGPAKKILLSNLGRQTVADTAITLDSYELLILEF